jgi:hypothetical protein
VNGKFHIEDDFCGRGFSGIMYQPATTAGLRKQWADSHPWPSTSSQ